MKVFNNYHCPKCDKDYERLADPESVVTCRECGAEMTKKLAAPMTNGNSAHGMLHRRTF